MMMWFGAITVILLLFDAAAAQGHGDTESTVRCGNEWITFALPGVSEVERKAMQSPVANAPKGSVLSIPKTSIRNLILYTDTGGGEVVFFLETGSKDRPKVFYSGLVTLDVYADVVECLD